MRHALTAMAILFTLGILLTSCQCHEGGEESQAPENGGQSETPPSGKRSPAEDLRRLQALFVARGGQLTTRDDTRVVWRDTAAFRVYEFTHHTVVLGTYDWQDDAFEVIIIAGHLPTSGDLFEAVLYDYDAANVRYENAHIKFSLDQPAIEDVSFLGFHLGQPRADVIEAHTKNIREAWPNDPEEREICMGNLGEASEDRNFSHGEIGKIHFSFCYEEQRLAYMVFRTENIGPLGALSIGHPTMPALTQGVLDLPRK